MGYVARHTAEMIQWQREYGACLNEKKSEGRLRFVAECGDEIVFPLEPGGLTQSSLVWDAPIIVRPQKDKTGYKFVGCWNARFWWSHRDLHKTAARVFDLV
jgi:hypothetical protein